MQSGNTRGDVGIDPYEVCGSASFAVGDDAYIVQWQYQICTMSVVRRAADCRPYILGAV